LKSNVFAGIAFMFKEKINISFPVIYVGLKKQIGKAFLQFFIYKAVLLGFVG